MRNVKNVRYNNWLLVIVNNQLLVYFCYIFNDVFLFVFERKRCDLLLRTRRFSVRHPLNNFLQRFLKLHLCFENLKKNIRIQRFLVVALFSTKWRSPRKYSHNFMKKNYFKFLKNVCWNLFQIKMWNTNDCRNRNIRVSTKTIVCGPKLAPTVNFAYAPVNNGAYSHPKLIVPRADLHRAAEHVGSENNFMLKEVAAIAVRTCAFTF